MLHARVGRAKAKKPELRDQLQWMCMCNPDIHCITTCPASNNLSINLAWRSGEDGGE